MSRYKHGDSHTKLHQVWIAMRNRCRNEKHKNYKYYGGRGIKTLPEWEDYKVFKNWAFSAGYEEGLTIDRINNDGNYEPTNCRWTTMLVQVRNRRRRESCVSKYEGVYFKKANNKWCAAYRRKYIGLYETEEKAAKAVQQMKDERMGL